MYQFIVNPHARSGLGKKIWTEVESYLDTQQIKYEVYFTKYQRHATKLIRQLTFDEELHTIVVLGGDGTINEVINGITDNSRIILGYIPCGSSNDFSRSLKLPTNPLEAIQKIISSSRTVSVDIGIMQYNKHVQKFAVSSGIGFDAAICHEVVVSKLKLFLNRIKLGKLTYVCIALHQLFSSTPCTFRITLDDETQRTFHNTYFAAIMNHPYEGGGCKFCPKANPSDGRLDLIVVSNISKAKVLCILPTVFKGWHTHFKPVTILSGIKFSIETEFPLAVHTDGEPIFLQKQITVSLDPKQLKVIV